MYVGTIVEWEDQSQISSLPIEDVRTQPLYLSLFTSDKGPEDWTVTSGEDWFKTYGKSISFAKHGQPLLQAAVSINAGARLLSKRLVATDATLANFSIVATVTKESVQATDASGKPLYTDAEGNETTEAEGDAGANTPKMINVAKIKYEGKSVEDIKLNKPEDVYDAVKATVGEGSYLLYTITDNGRGTSNKRFSINPEYRLSRSKNYIEYTFNVTENGTSIESLMFNPCTNIVTSGSNHSLQSVISTNSSQVACVQDDEGINNFVAAIAEACDMTVEDVMGLDFLFGYNKKQVKLSNIEVDDSGIALNSSFGQALLEGTNGAMGETPIEAVDEYVKQAERALGTDPDYVYDTSIFNLDQYKIDVVIDANYPEGVKRAIENLVTFREDCVFLRDYGLGLDTYDKIATYNAEISVKNKFIADYPISYDVIDPYSKKQISVTVGYTLARLMVTHLNAGRILPVCGIKHDMIITDAIKGTLNFSPVVCPEPLGNQKEAMEEIRANYASYIGEDLVIETEYTSQDELTQFSFLNNVLGTQEVVRAIRTRCPVIRYSFIDGEDLERYKADIDDVVSQFKSNFKSIEFQYVADPTYVNNKIFYAALKVCHRDFIQTEWFKVTAINVTES